MDPIELMEGEACLASGRIATNISGRLMNSNFYEFEQSSHNEMLCHRPWLIPEKFKRGNYYNFMLKIRYSQQRKLKTLDM